MDDSLSPYDLTTLRRVVEAGNDGALVRDAFQAQTLSLAGLITRASRTDGRYEATVTGKVRLRQSEAS